MTGQPHKFTPKDWPRHWWCWVCDHKEHHPIHRTANNKGDDKGGDAA